MFIFNYNWTTDEIISNTILPNLKNRKTCRPNCNCSMRSSCKPWWFTAPTGWIETDLSQITSELLTKFISNTILPNLKTRKTSRPNYYWSMRCSCKPWWLTAPTGWIEPELSQLQVNCWRSLYQLLSYLIRRLGKRPGQTATARWGVRASLGDSLLRQDGPNLN